MTIPTLARLPQPTPSKPALSSRTLASRLRRSLALMTEAPAVQPVPMLGARSYAEGGTVEVDPYADYYAPEMTDGFSYGYQVDETEPEPVEPEPVEMTQGSAVEAIAQALSEAHAQENPPISYEASFKDVSRPVGPVEGPSFEAFQEPLAISDYYTSPAEVPQIGRFEQGLGDAVRFIGETLSDARTIIDPLGSLTRDVRPGEQGTETTDIYGEGPTIQPLMDVRNYVGEKYDEYAAPVVRAGAAMTGLGVGIDYLRGEEPGDTAAAIGKAIAESIIPTNPLEVGLEFAPGIGDARGLYSAVRNFGGTEAAAVLGRGGAVPALGRGLAAAGARAGDAALNVAAAPGRLFPAGSIDEGTEATSRILRGTPEANPVEEAIQTIWAKAEARLNAANPERFGGAALPSPFEYLTDAEKSDLHNLQAQLRNLGPDEARQRVLDRIAQRNLPAGSSDELVVPPAPSTGTAGAATPPPRVPPAAAGAAVPPPPRPPAPNTAAAFDGIIPGESVPDAAFRQYEGAVETAARAERVNLTEGATKMRAAGKAPGKVDDEVRALFSSLHGAGETPPNLQGVADDVKALLAQEEALTLDFDPRFALHPDYFPRYWETPKPTTPRPKALGAKPGFVKPRVDATFDELVAAGYKPKTWDPYEMVALRRMAGAEYREQSKLLGKLRDADLVADVVGPLPDGWRIPDVTGAVFQPKPYVDAAGEIRFTSPKMVPNGVANVLEQLFGRKLNWGTVGNVDVHNVVAQVFNAPKRVKLMGSFFQQMDFATRTGFSTMGGAIDDLAHGKPLSAIGKVAKLPANVGDLVIANVSPARRTALRQALVSNVPVNSARPGVTWNLISRQGLGGGDVSAFNKTMRDAIVQATPTGITGRPRRVANAINGALERGLFEGVYPQAQKTAIENFLGPAIIRAHPSWSDEQIAASIAVEANKMFSSLPRSQSALRHINRNLTEVSRMLIFSTNETESFLKATASTFKGPNKAMWAEYWAGGTLFLTALAETIHFAVTGEPLPTERLSPFTAGGPFGVQYNARFLSPDVPLKGRGGTNLTVDLLGQMDTVLRLVDPASFIKARENVVPRAVSNQLTERDYFGRPLDTTKRKLGQLAMDVGAPIPVQNMTASALKRFPALEGWIADQEARLGEGAQLAQIPGFNLRAETNQMIRDRMALESGYSGVKKWDDLLESQKQEIMQRPENKGLVGELETRGDELAATGNAYAEYQKLVREGEVKAKEQALTIDAELKAGTISGADARRAWDGLIQNQAKANDARREMPAVKAVLDSFGDAKDLTPAQEAQRDYFAIFDKPGVKLPNGDLDFNRYDKELSNWQVKYPDLAKTDVSPGSFLSPEHQRQEAASKRLSEAGYFDAQDKAFELAKKLASLPDASPEQRLVTRFETIDDLRNAIETELRRKGTPETQIDSSRAKIEEAIGLTRLSNAFEDQVIKVNPRLIIDLEEWYGAPKRLREYAADVAGVR